MAKTFLNDSKYYFAKILTLLKILNELVEIPINDRLIPADREHVVGTIRPINILELTPHLDKILFGIELYLIGILFRQLP